MERASKRIGRNTSIHRHASRKQRSAAKLTNRHIDVNASQSGDDHAHVLYAIETALVRCHQDDERVDDAVAMSALRSMVEADPPTSMPSAWVFAELADARHALSDLTADGWNECLLLAIDSLGQQSPLRTGDTQYLRSLCRSVA